MAKKKWVSKHKIIAVILALIIIVVIVFSSVKPVRQKVIAGLQINATALESEMASASKQIKGIGNQKIRDIKVSFIDSLFGSVSVTIDATAFYASSEGAQKDFVYAISVLYNEICKNNGLTLGCETTMHSDSGRIIAKGTGQGDATIY